MGSCWSAICTSLSIKSAPAGDLLSSAERLSLLNLLHQGRSFSTHQFYFHFHFLFSCCVCGLWSSRSQLRQLINTFHVSKREKCNLSKHRGKWICQGRRALLTRFEDKQRHYCNLCFYVCICRSHFQLKYNSIIISCISNPGCSTKMKRFCCHCLWDNFVEIAQKKKNAFEQHPSV